MTSSTLTGERRWASARRSGMTVLGKVAVPKPINLPSQRLENHGLDPNVEIVPKGTLSWGSRGSSSASNAWGSLTLSPNADSGPGSPSHLSGRPSSGGSGTRPSTAGSDRAHEPIANAWGSNSRPSSASGVLTSSQTSLASLRPRSAETRPGSSQLSRFAEPLSESSGVWGGAGTAEKLGVTSSKNEGFSLTSGDFPTLGSEKDGSGKNAESQDDGNHTGSGSSSGRVVAVKERTGTSAAGDVSVIATGSGSVNSWRRDNYPYVEDGVQPSMEKWQMDAQGPRPYPNASITPPQFDAWRGPPINNHPGGVWYRGPPGATPYGPSVAPTGFPMDPFPYYRPQIPAAALANPQSIPPPGAGPRGHHPKNGDMYRAPLPDGFIRPAMPLRPGFYPGPVAYEGYYGPPMGYCNSNERDIPFMGMPAGPSAYNRYAGQTAPDTGIAHVKSSAHGPATKALASEQETSHHHETQGPYKVLLKQHDGWDGKDEEKCEYSVRNNESCVEKRDHRRPSSWEKDWKADHGKDAEKDTRRTVVIVEASSHSPDHRGGGSSVTVKSKSHVAGGNLKAFDDMPVKKVDHAVASCPEVSAAKDSSLIQKIEGLNAKARASDGRRDVVSLSSRDEENKKLPVDNSKISYSVSEAHTGAVCGNINPGRAQASEIIDPASHEVGDSSVSKNVELAAAGGTAIPRRPAHGLHGRADHRGKGRSNAQDDGWRKKTPVADTSIAMLAANCDYVHMQNSTSMEAIEKPASHPQGKDEGDSMLDPSDSQAQRAMMRELAKQRVKQRQKEEEERAREQRAKALAKLEDLNRRTQVVEDVPEKSEAASGSAIQNKLEEPGSHPDPPADAFKVVASSSASDSDVVVQIGGSSNASPENSTALSNELPLETIKISLKESMPSKKDVNSAESAQGNNDLQVGGAPKQKRMGYKQKQNVPLEKNSTEKVSSASTPEGVNAVTSTEVLANEIASTSESTLPVSPNTITESSVHQRRKNNRSGKNRHRVEEGSSAAALPLVAKETNLSFVSAESGKPKASESGLDSGSTQSPKESKDANDCSEQHLSLPNEEIHGRVNNQWKSQQARRTLRNPPANKPAEKFHTGDAVVWAPVRTHNKSEVANEASQKAVIETINPATKSDHPVHNNTRSKRAEMERYVPKPAVKEMAQQGGNQQVVASSVNQTMSDETVGRVDCGSQSSKILQPAVLPIGKVVSTPESRNDDARQNKHGKVHGSWRQRGSAESTPGQGLQERQSSNSSRNVQKSSEHHEPQKHDVSSVGVQSKYSDEWNASDSWKIPEHSDSALPTAPLIKDEGMTGRGKQHVFRGQKGTGNNHDDHKKIKSGPADKIYLQSSVPEMSQSDLSAGSKESRAAGDRSTSHWQPKSQAPLFSYQRGNRPSGGQNVEVEAARASKKDSAYLAEVPHQSEEEANEWMGQHHQGQIISDKSKVEEAPNSSQQEPRRERKTASIRAQLHSANLGPGGPVEPAVSSNVDIRFEQRQSSGFRKNGNHSSRFGRGQEFHGEMGSSGPDNKQHSLPGNRDKQRQLSHYEYQPIGLHNNDKANNSERGKDGSHNPAPRFRERGQSHPRRGGWNFYGRQSGGGRADVSYD